LARQLCEDIFDAGVAVIGEFAGRVMKLSVQAMVTDLESAVI
jgi:hypothetical protein